MKKMNSMRKLIVFYHSSYYNGIWRGDHRRWSS